MSPAEDFLAGQGPKVRGKDRVPSEEAEAAAAAKFKADADRAMSAGSPQAYARLLERESESGTGNVPVSEEDKVAARAAVEAKLRGEVPPSMDEIQKDTDQDEIAALKAKLEAAEAKKAMELAAEREERMKKAAAAATLQQQSDALAKQMSTPKAEAEAAPQERKVAFVDIQGFQPSKFFVGDTREWLSANDERTDPAIVEKIHMDTARGMVVVVCRSMDPGCNGQIQEIVAPLTRCTVVYECPMPKELPADVANLDGNVKPISLLTEEDKQQLYDIEARKLAAARRAELEAVGV